MIFQGTHFENADTSDIAQAGAKKYVLLLLEGTKDTYLHLSGVGTTKGTAWAWSSTRERGDRLIAKNGLVGFVFVRNDACGKRPAPVNDLNDI